MTSIRTPFKTCIHYFWSKILCKKFWYNISSNLVLEIPSSVTPLRSIFQHSSSFICTAFTFSCDSLHILLSMDWYSPFLCHLMVPPLQLIKSPEWWLLLDCESPSALSATSTIYLFSFTGDGYVGVGTISSSPATQDCCMITPNSDKGLPLYLFCSFLLNEPPLNGVMFWLSRLSLKCVLVVLWGSCLFGLLLHQEF